jgi:hypothetical protein
MVDQIYDHSRVQPLYGLVMALNHLAGNYSATSKSFDSSLKGEKP